MRGKAARQATIPTPGPRLLLGIAGVVALGPRPIALQLGGPSACALMARGFQSCRDFPDLGPGGEQISG